MYCCTYALHICSGPSIDILNTENNNNDRSGTLNFLFSDDDNWPGTYINNFYTSYSRYLENLLHPCTVATVVKVLCKPEVQLADTIQISIHNPVLLNYMRKLQLFSFLYRARIKIQK